MSQRPAHPSAGGTHICTPGLDQLSWLGPAEPPNRRVDLRAVTSSRCFKPPPFGSGLQRGSRLPIWSSNSAEPFNSQGEVREAFSLRQELANYSQWAYCLCLQMKLFLERGHIHSS